MMIISTYYALERQLTVHPSKCWISRIQHTNYGKSVTPLMGEFLGVEGQTAAQEICAILNKNIAHFRDDKADRRPTILIGDIPDAG